jgi:hypothetical protein
MAADVKAAMRPAATVAIVGVILIRMREGPGVHLELDFDPEARLWHNLEGRATQRVVFDVLRARPPAGMLRQYREQTWHKLDARHI